MVQLAGAFFVFIFLQFNIAPIIYSGDSSLFTTAGFYLSPAHPPGYPFFVMLEKSIDFLPFASVGYRSNLLNAFLGAACYLVLFHLIYRLVKNKGFSFFYSFLPFLLPAVLTESLKAEVYILNVVLCLLVLYYCLKIEDEGDMRIFPLIFFCFGLGTGNHHTMALMLLPVIYIALKKIRRPQPVLMSLLFFMAGLAINLQTYFRSIKLKTGGFLYVDASTLGKVIGTFLRKQYGAGSSVQAVEGIASVNRSSFLFSFKNVFSYILFENLGMTVTLLSVLLLILGLLLTKSRKKSLILFLSFLPWIAVLGRMTLNMEIPSDFLISTVTPYYLPLLFITSIMLSSGVYQIYLLIKPHMKSSYKVFSVFLLIPFLYLPPTLNKVNIKNDYLAYDRARDTFNMLPLRSWVFLYGDNPTFTSFYLEWVERYREDTLTMHTDKKSKRIRTDDSLLYKNYILYGLKDKDLFSESLNARDTEVLRPILLRNHLFSLHQNALDDFKQKDPLLKNYSALLLFGAYEKGAQEPYSLMKEFMLKNYDKLNFERSMVYSEDLFATEIRNQYGFSLLLSASELSLPPHEKAKLSIAGLRLVNPESFIPYYVSLLAEQGRTEKAFEYLESTLRNYPVSRMADLAHVTEYVLLKRKGEEKKAREKYAFLEKHGLLIFLDQVEKLIKIPSGPESVSYSASQL